MSRLCDYCNLPIEGSYYEKNVSENLRYFHYDCMDSILDTKQESMMLDMEVSEDDT